MEAATIPKPIDRGRTSMSLPGSRALSAAVLALAGLTALAAPAAAQVRLDPAHGLGLMNDVLADTVTVPDGVIPVDAPHLRLVRDDTLVPEGSLGATSCLAALDWDGDGDLDVFVGNVDTGGVPSHLLVNDGGGRWRLERPPGLPANAMFAARADVDNDGRDDLVVVGRDSLYEFDLTSDSALARPGKILERYLRLDLLVRAARPGCFVDVPVDLPPSLLDNVDIAGLRNPVLGDWERDGLPDLLVTHTPRTPGGGLGPVSYVRLRNEGGRFAVVQVLAADPTPGDAGAGTTSWFSVEDLDADGWPDMVVNPSSSFFQADAPLLLRRGGADGFAAVPETLDCARDPKSLAPTWVDADGDGDLDLLAGQFDAQGGRNDLYLQDPPGRWRPLGAAAGLWGGYSLCMGFAWGDLDDDGLPDLVTLRFGSEGSARTQTVLRNLGAGRFGTVRGALQPPLETALQAALLLDLDDDGDLDLLAAPTAWYVDKLDLAATRTVAYRNDSTGGRSLVLRLEGTDSGRSALGARARVTVGGRTWLRFCGEAAAAGYTAPPADLHVGLGEAAAADSVTVRWPSGLVECWTELAAGRRHLLVEGRGRPLR
jgi:hypothetical protein